MGEDEKTCPKCAETVKAAAEICKHCGYNFRAGTVADNPSPAPKAGMSKGKGCLIALGVLVGLGVVASLAGGDGAGSAASVAEAEADQRPAIKVSAVQLAQAYEANEAAAQQQYGGSKLEVTGTIKSIDLNYADKPFIVLEGVNMFMGPQMDLTEASQAKAGSLSKGTKVTAICSDVSEAVGTPMLKSCEIQ